MNHHPYLKTLKGLNFNKNRVEVNMKDDLEKDLKEEIKKSNCWAGF